MVAKCTICNNTSAEVRVFWRFDDRLPACLTARKQAGRRIILAVVFTGDQ